MLTNASSTSSSGNDDNNEASSAAYVKSLHPNVRLAGCQHVHRLLFTKMRQTTTTSSEFVQYSQRSMQLLAEDALASFPTFTKEITTPCGTCTGYFSKADSSSASSTGPPKITAVSIVRSGDALLESVRSIDPTIKVGKILIQRNEESVDKHAVLIYQKLPPTLDFVLLCDPMLATGGSAIKALEVLTSPPHNVPPSKIIFANMISAPEGLKRLAQSQFKDVQIVTVAIDPALDENKYIVPGLGDYGDRFYNTAGG